jgi:hypothetical protein
MLGRSWLLVRSKLSTANAQVACIAARRLTGR